MTHVSFFPYRWFWISWKDNRIQVGEGRVPEISPSLSADKPDPAYAVQALAIASGVEAQWEFAELPGK